MEQVAPKLWVGSQADFEKLDEFGTEWAVVFGARDPWHRQLLGYTGRGAPSDHPEYLCAWRGKRMYLNLIDGPDPKYVNRHMVDSAVKFIGERLAALDPDKPEAVAVFCNQGGSRAPTLALLYMAPSFPEDFEAAVTQFTAQYPNYAPAEGMKGFARIHWRHYRNRKATGAPEAVEETNWTVDKSRELWATFVDDLKSCPSQAVDKHISAISTALRDAANGKLPGKRETID